MYLVSLYTVIRAGEEIHNIVGVHMRTKWFKFTGECKSLHTPQERMKLFIFYSDIALLHLYFFILYKLTGSSLIKKNVNYLFIYFQILYTVP